MRTIVVNLATGIDNSVDPRIAPNGTVNRTQNVRIDREGRLVCRHGYQSLGMTTHDGGGALVPFDLANFDGELMALGNNSLANQTGIRSVYQYVNTIKGAWRTTHDNSSGLSADNSNAFFALPSADSVRVVRSDAKAKVADSIFSDVAATLDGNFVCTATSDGVSTNIHTSNPSSGDTVHYENLLTEFNARLLVIGVVFYLFTQAAATPTQVTVRTFNPVTDTAFSSGTTFGATIANAPYDVANLENSTDYLIVLPTGTGYTWRRHNSAHVQQTTTNVVSLANAAATICGGSGEVVCVANIRAVSGIEVRSFVIATGVLSLGPINADATGVFVFDSISIARDTNGTTVNLVGHVPGATPVAEIMNLYVVTTASFVVVLKAIVDGAKNVSKPLMITGQPFVWAAIGPVATFRSYGLFSLPTGIALRPHLEALVFNGNAKKANSAATVAFNGKVALGAVNKYYVSLVTLDPADKTFRANLVEFKMFSGERRQCVTLDGRLHIAGGLTTQYDGQVSVGVGFEVDPSFFLASGGGPGGGLTLLGTYQTQIVFRFVGRDGRKMQSTPSAVVTTTLVGAQDTLFLTFGSPYGEHMGRKLSSFQGTLFADIYRTEANGSIPRLSQSFEMTSTQISGNVFTTIPETNADTVVQSGAPIYTQGAAGSVSGRLPLGIAQPCRFIAESNGKLMNAGLEREQEFQLSVESRPGETLGFVNDDLFFGTNPEKITGVVTGTDGRRYVFSRNNIREILGDGPNAAGIGDLSEPIAVDGQVGCVDWRSIVATELGVFFQSNNDTEPKIHLLPHGGGVPISAAESIQDTLQTYPIITSATRHEADQLVTFTLTNVFGTDGRIVHLDLRTSGMGKAGWEGRWIIDRLVATEGVPDIEVVAEGTLTFEALTQVFQVTGLPQPQVTGDRVVVYCTAQGSTTLLSSGLYTLLHTRANTNETVAWFERILVAGSDPSFFNITSSIFTSGIVHWWHLRNTHPSQASEAASTAIASSTTHLPPPLTPSWGSTKDLWFTALGTAFAFLTLPVTSLITSRPSGFSGEGFAVMPESGLLGGEADWGRTVLTTGTLTPTAFANTGGSISSIVSTFAVRGLPIGSGKTPCRSSSFYRGRLVVSTDTDVLLNSPTSFADGSAFIAPEIELATVYAMGRGGAARHLGIVFVGEFRGRCVLRCSVSYDDGLTYTELRPFTLNSQSYTVGQAVRLQWVPKRRKVEGVRVKFTVSEDAGSGPSEGLVFNEAYLQFEELLGPSRLAQGNRK